LTTRGDLVHGLVRRAVFWYILFVIAVLQTVFVAVYGLGIDFDPAYMVWIVPCALPVTLTAWRIRAERPRLASFRLDPWWTWALLGAGMFGFWAGSYFLVGAITDPERVRLLSPALDRFVPFRPQFVWLYLCVYPVFLLPFLRAGRAAMHRLVVGYLVMFAVSYTIFLWMPVAFDRPVLAETPPDFSQWALRMVYGRDPPWNCMPSTHCAVALLAGLALWESGRAIGWFGLCTATCIGISTMYTKQHYIVDVVAGFTLAAVTWRTLQWIWRNPERVPEPARKLIVASREEQAGVLKPSRR
jgi:membrane-associated phospholipid phosphatase